MVLIMRFGVSGKTLLITAGMVWLIAGGNILRIGVSCWLDSEQYWLLKLGETSLVFLLFSELFSTDFTGNIHTVSHRSQTRTALLLFRR